MKFLCNQIILFILTTLISYIFLIYKIGVSTFIEYEKLNSYIDLGYFVTLFSLILFLCSKKFNILAWIIYGITLIFTIIEIYSMYFSKMSNINGLKKFVNIEKEDNLNYFQTFEKITKSTINKDNTR